ncbi:hypothetical protein ACWY4P_30700 [Streptomyces sp. LZ34]
MAFPTTPLDTTVELFINSVWTDVTADCYLRDPITITRGRTAQGDQVDPSRCTVTFNNRNGKYSPRNPTGAYYGKIGRNTPLRVSVRAGSNALDLPQGASAYASTPDVSALDITGDIDIRVDGTLTNWLSPETNTLNTTVLVAKLGPAGNKSWMLAVRDYGLYFEWSPDGSTVLSAGSTLPLPAGPDTRTAVRVTLDVDNGAGGRTATFYTASSMGGTWAQLGDPVTASGTTSIFNSTGPVQLGSQTYFAFSASRGKIHAAQIRSGIAGTVVANPDFSAQATGTTSFTDSAGRTWTTQSGATITNRQIRFVGEVSEWPTEWDVSGQDVYTQVTAAGLLRRLTQGVSPIKSTLTRRIPTMGPLAYWPMEEGASATKAYSPIEDVPDMQAVGFTWASVDTLAGSAALPTVGNTSILRGPVPRPSGTPTSWHVEFVYNLSSVTATPRSVMKIASSGTVREWALQLSTGAARIFGTDEDGAVIVNDTYAVGSDLYDGRWNRWQFRLSASGGTVTYTSQWANVGGVGGSASNTYSGSIGRVLDVHSPETGFSQDLSGMGLGHIAVFSPQQLSAYENVDIGLSGETAGTRMVRLTAEERILFALFGNPGIQAPVGPQKPATVLDILGDAAEADGGILYEQRSNTGLIYRDTSSLYNQPVRLALNYATAGHISPPFKPSDDDQYLRNEVTVTRRDGTSAVASLDVGPLSTQAPPNGVGRYQDSKDINFYDDDQPAQMAQWLIYMGTWDEARYPTVHVDLSAGVSLTEDVTAVDVGDRITISNPPPWLPPDQIDLIAQGYTEVIGVYDWDVTFNCTPGGPWSHVAQVGTSRADTAGSTLATGVTATATALSIATGSGPVWADSVTYPSDFPFDVLMAGERMTVTAISGSTSPQTFTVVRSVNGVSKAQSAGAIVRLFSPAYVAL